MGWKDTLQWKVGIDVNGAGMMRATINGATVGFMETRVAQEIDLWAVVEFHGSGICACICRELEPSLMEHWTQPSSGESANMLSASQKSHRYSRCEAAQKGDLNALEAILACTLEAEDLAFQLRVAAG